MECAELTAVDPVELVGTEGPLPSRIGGYQKGSILGAAFGTAKVTATGIENPRTKRRVAMIILGYLLFMHVVGLWFIMPDQI